MGRGNTAERLQKAKNKLDAASKLQGELGKQALKAIENGADPSLAFSLAEAAAKEVLIEDPTPEMIAYKQEEINRLRIESKTENVSLDKIVYIKNLRSNFDGSIIAFHGGLDGDYNGVPFFIQFNENNIAQTSSIVAEFLLRREPDNYALVEE